jgi:DNA-binding IclR family transcriptional regulator
MAILAAVEGGARSFTDIQRATGFTRPTTHRLIRSAEDHGLLMQVGGLGYRLGPRLLGLANRAMRELPLRDLAHPILERLTRTTGESAQLYVRDGDRRVCIDGVESSSELRTIVQVGSELPITAGSAGKVFMAWLPEPGRSHAVASAQPLTDRTPTGERLEGQLGTVRRLGYATSAGERQAGVGSVSAPVLDPLGALVAVVSISGPESRIGRISGKRFASAVVAAAREVEEALGGGFPGV